MSVANLSLMVMTLLLLLFVTFMVPFAAAQPNSTTETTECKDNGSHCVGVSFSTIVKAWKIPANGSGSKPESPWFIGTNRSEIKAMLRLISSRYRSIITCSNQGTFWDSYASAKAAAELNRKTGTLAVTVAQGINCGRDLETQLKNNETDTALLEIQKANENFPGTVWALVVLNDNITATNVPALHAMLKRYKQNSTDLGIKIGMRIHNCQDGQSLYLYNRHLWKPMLDIILACDFVICTMFPFNFQPPTTTASTLTVAVTPEESASRVFNLFQKMASEFRIANPLGEMILETWWPSQGVSTLWNHNGIADKTSNTLINMRRYWTAVAELSRKFKIRTYMHEAVDQPWKSNYNLDDAKKPNGRCGADGHFGWWRRVNNSDETSYVEKVFEKPEPEILKCTDLGGGSEANPGSPVLLIMLVMIGLLAIVIPIIVFLVCHLRRAQKAIIRLSAREIKEFKEGCKGSAYGVTGTQDLAQHLPYDQSYEICKDHLKIEKDQILGSGQFGIVYKGKVEGTVVALKTIKSKSADCVSQLRNLLSELKIMIYIGKHENIVALLGAYTAEMRNGVVFLAMEFCSVGNLETHLRKYSKLCTSGSTTTGGAGSPIYANFLQNQMVSANSEYQNVDLGLSQLVKWTCEIARGMEWLAGRQVVHADLSTRNILLTENRTAKITDFGLSRRLYEYTNYVKKSQEPLPWRWMAIESLRSLTFSSYSDVWAFGVTAWEIFTLGSLQIPTPAFLLAPRPREQANFCRFVNVLSTDPSPT